MPITVRTFDQLDAAAAALAADRSARFLGGGTVVMRLLNEGHTEFSTLVRTTDPSFREIRPGSGRIVLGAGVTMAAILKSPDLAFLHPAAREIGGPAVRQMATVGGNLFVRAPYGDLTTALLALEAMVTVRGGYSPREIRLEDLLRSRERGAGGIVSQITLVRPSNRISFRFLKMSRVHPHGAPVITIAADLPTSGGRVAGAKVAYGGMAPTPIRVPAVERALEGRALDETGIAAALAAATEGTAPLTCPVASAWYRREMAPVQLRRLLLSEGGAPA